MGNKNVILLNADSKWQNIASSKNANAILILTSFVLLKCSPCTDITNISKPTPSPSFWYVKWYIFANINGFLAYLLIILAIVISILFTILCCSSMGGSGMSNRCKALEDNP